MYRQTRRNLDNALVQNLVSMAMKLIHEIHDDGNQVYFYVKDGKEFLHRLNGPAIVHADGDQRWYFHGELHRRSGPALISSIGRKEWFLYGVRHNFKGPAITLAYPTNPTLYYLFGNSIGLSFADYYKRIGVTDINNLVEISLKILRTAKLDSKGQSALFKFLQSRMSTKEFKRIKTLTSLTR